MANKVNREPITAEYSDGVSELISSVVDNLKKNSKADIRFTVGDDDSEYGQDVPYWVRTFIPQLDYAVGGKMHPGFPGARIVEIFGAEGSGKSTMAVWVTKCGINQLNTFALYQDAENVLTPEIIKGTQINMKKVIVHNPDTMEQAFSVQESTLEALSKNPIKRPVITVLDSVAACPTQAEVEADYGDSTMATQARALSTALKKIKTPIRDNHVLSIFVNQIRDKMNVSWGKTTTTSCGKALPFYSSVRIEMTRTGYVKSGNEVTGGTYKASVIKNKVSAPMKTAEFQIDFVYDENGNSFPQINIWLALLNWCKDHELLEGSAGRVVLNGKSMYFKDAVKLMKSDEELFNQIVELAYSVGKDKQE